MTVKVQFPLVLSQSSIISHHQPLLSLVINNQKEFSVHQMENSIFRNIISLTFYFNRQVVKKEILCCLCKLFKKKYYAVYLGHFRLMVNKSEEI